MPDLARAEQLLALRGPGEALEIARHVLSEAPDSAQALFVAGRALSRLDRHAEAEQALRRAAALEPESIEVLIALAPVVQARGLLQEAIAIAQHAVRLRPHAWQTHYEYGRLLVAGNRRNVHEAYAAATQAVRLAPNHPDPHNLLGMCHDRMRAKAAARAAYEKAVALDPEHPMALNNLATLDLAPGRLGRGARPLRAALSAAPQGRIQQHNLDILLVRLGFRLVLVEVVAWVVLGIVLSVEVGHLARAGIAGALLVLLVTLAVRSVRHLPAGMRRSPFGLVRRLARRHVSLTVLLLVLALCLPVLGLAPDRLARPLAMVGIAVGPVVMWCVLLENIGRRLLSGRRLNRWGG